MADSDNNTLTPPPKNSALENYTGSELPYKALYLSGIALGITAVIFAVALIPMRDAMIASADKRNADGIPPSTERPAKSRLQQSPEAEWQAYEAWVAHETSTFGWQDKANELVRIPLDRAVALALEEGLIASSPNAKPAVFLGAAASHDDTSHGDSSHTAEEAAH